MNLQALITEVLNHMRGMWRYRWRLVVVAWLIAISGWAIVYNMPDIYLATAKIAVETDSLLPDLTKGLTVGENLAEEVILVSRTISSRPILMQVARDTGLDSRAKTPEKMEKLITSMQRTVNISLINRNKVFALSFQHSDRKMATDVIAALVKFFVKSSRAAGDDAEMAERAIKSEIDHHEARLLQAESDLADFKKLNLGYMPDDGSDYYTRLQSVLAGVSQTEKQLRQLQQRRDEISRQLAGEVSLLEASSSPALILASCSKSATITDLRAQLSALQVDFTEKHPRIVMLRETLNAMESECRQELASTGGMIARQESVGKSGEVNTVYQNLRLLLSNADVDLVSLNEELRIERQQVSRLRGDVDKIGTVERDLKKLNRDYGVIEARYQELLRRWETLRSKQRLDPVTETLQFHILEPPFAAAKPIAPNRFLLLVAVFFLALGTGGAVVFGFNQLKPVFFSQRALAQGVGIPVLGSVSMILSPGEVSARRRRNVAWVGANLALFVMAGFAIALRDPISEFVRSLTGSGV